jgi:SAM-dependent methyltransferase
MNELLGFCPICESVRSFEIHGPWYRDQLICPACLSIPRERALAEVLQRTVPNWRERDIHESSPANRGISAKLQRENPNYVASHFYPNIEEVQVNGFLNIDLEHQNFADDLFDIFISLDVMEHVLNPQAAICEIYRTLKPGGYAFMTFPIISAQVEPLRFRVRKVDSAVEYLEPPIWHGNPIGDNQSLVTVDYGYDVHKELSSWSNFNIEIVRMCRSDIGVMGEMTEVIVCRK